MRRMAMLCVGVLCCFTGSLYAQQAGGGKDMKPREMSGTICSSKCVTKVENLSTCDTSCTDKSEDLVLVDDQGNVMKIENKSMAMPHMVKHVKMMAVPTEKQREEQFRILDISLSPGKRG